MVTRYGDPLNSDTICTLDFRQWITVQLDLGTAFSNASKTIQAQALRLGTMSLFAWLQVIR